VGEEEIEGLYFEESEEDAVDTRTGVYEEESDEESKAESEDEADEESDEGGKADSETGVAEEEGDEESKAESSNEGDEESDEESAASGIEPNSDESHTDDYDETYTIGAPDDTISMRVNISSKDEDLDQETQTEGRHPTLV
jgi:hypothetical protein